MDDKLLYLYHDKSMDSALIEIEQTYLRLWSIHTGRLLVVTDLHADWEVYSRIRDRFLDLHRAGQADALVLTGDVIHGEPEEKPDRSVEMVLDIMRLQREYPNAVFYLLGNHEMPHIYGTSLARGERDYTSPFEAALVEMGVRDRVRAFFSDLPFFIRTTAGITITHAGASLATANPQTAQALFTWNHHALLNHADAVIAEKSPEHLRQAFARLHESASYADLSARWMAVDDPADAHYDDLLRGFLVSMLPAYKLLWAALFTRCEKQYPDRYPEILNATLENLSHGFTPQRILVSGHMVAPGGLQVIAGRQLRLASAAHAVPRSSGRCLLFDAAQPVDGVKDLLSGLQKIF